VNALLFYILVAVLLFGLLIAVHEGGHFLAAKILGVRVNEFSIGMGPLIVSKQKGETRYSLRLFPIGGFCAMEGEDEDTEAPDSFAKKPAWKKLIILAAGSFMNFLAGLLILLLLFAPTKSLSVPVIADLMDGFPNESESGLLPGDRLLSINDRKVHIVNDAQLYLNLAKGDTMDLVIERDGVRLERTDFPLSLREYTVEGETVMRFGLYFDKVEATPGLILQQTWDTALYFARTVWIGFQMLFQGDAGLKDLAGPVGIVSLIGETGTQSASMVAGLKNVCYIIALVAVNLAIVNMLPIPALDGGRIFLVLLNRIYFFFTHRSLNPKYESYVHAIGFMLLILLMVVVTFQDVIKLVN